MGWPTPPSACRGRPRQLARRRDWALPVVALVGGWRLTSFVFVVYLAGLTSIPRSVYEAADVDGVRGFARLRHVTLPLLAPTTVFVAVFVTILTLQTFETVAVLTHGDPLGSSSTIIYYIYKVGFTGSFRIGYASAVALLLMLMIIAVGVVRLAARPPGARPRGKGRADMHRPHRTPHGADGRRRGPVRLLFVGVTSALLPFFWMLRTAVGPPQNAFGFSANPIPSSVDFSAFESAWDAGNLGTALATGIGVSLAILALQLATAVPAAYAFACLRFRGRNCCSRWCSRRCWSPPR